MGPLWGFDLSFGNLGYTDSQYAQGFWVKDNPWYTRLFQESVFVTKVNERFAYFTKLLIVKKYSDKSSY